MKRIMWIIVLAVLTTGTAYANFLDEFNSPVLDPGWQIEWEDSTHWSLTARPGFLRITTKYGVNDTIWNFFVHREGIAGNFEVTTKIIARPEVQGQCTFLYADNDSLFQQKPRVIAGFGNIAGVGKGVLGLIDSTSIFLPYNDTLVYIRIRTNGDTVFAEYSPDNSSWTTLISDWSPPFTEHQQSGVDAIIYPQFGGTPQTPEINADFDWFHLVALTGVDERPANGRATRADYLTVVPNPFTKKTVIRYSSLVINDQLPMTNDLQYPALCIYDVSGRLVRNLVACDLSSGALTWDGRDNSNGELQGGVYFIKLSSGDFTSVKKVILLR